MFLPYANNKGADQSAHPHSLIITFVVRCLDSIIPLVFIFKISSLYLASAAEHAGLSITLSETPETGFLMTWLISKLQEELLLTRTLKTCLLFAVKSESSCSSTEATENQQTRCVISEKSETHKTAVL